MNIKTSDILKCLPLLAAVLGDKYGVKVVIGGEKACTDGNVIHLPSLPLESDDEIAMLVKGYTDHESAHVRHTDFEALHKANLNNAEKTVFNYIEDWRVEHRLAEIFPGCRENLNRLIHRFFVEMDDWAEETPAIAIFNYILLSIRAWDVPEVEIPRRIRMYALDGQYPGLRENLDRILDRIRASCPDTPSAIDYAKEIMTVIQAWDDSHNANSQLGEQNEDYKDIETRKRGGSAVPQSSGTGAAATGDKDEEEDQNPPEETSDDSRDNPADGPDACPQVSSAQESCAEDTEAGHIEGITAYASENQDVEAQEEPLVNKVLSALEENAPQSLGDRLADELTRQSAFADGNGLAVARCASRWSAPMEESERLEAMQCCNGLKSRLQGLLQAQSLRGQSYGRRGRLAGRHLYRLNVGNPKVFVRESECRAVNTAIHLLLDRSYSMDGPRIRMARQVGYALSRTLDMIGNVNHAVTAFPDGSCGEAACDVIPLVRHGERTANNFGIGVDGSTPLGESLWWVIGELMAQKEARKIIIILTDGVPDNVAASKNAIASALKLGIEVYAVGIQTELLDLLGVSGRTIHTLDGLPKAVFELLQTTLLKGERK